MLAWQEQLTETVTLPEQLRGFIDNPEILQPVVKKYPLFINSYFWNLLKQKGSPLANQVIPHPAELEDTTGLIDPLAEERDSPVPNITHRYPDRVLFLISNICAINCRFCTRKRNLGKSTPVTDEQILAGVDYISKHREIRDVLLSGGDPLMLSDDRLEWIIGKVRAIAHVDIIRIGSRIPSALPHRITPDLIKMLQQFHPLYFNLHFNHPAELTPESRHACNLLADAGFPLGSQTVILRGINDDATVIIELMRGLLKQRVKPYYLLQGDLTLGTNHFRTKVQLGIDIIRKMRGHVSGMAVPALIMDLPEGGGKVQLLPEYIMHRNEREVVVKNYKGQDFIYPEP